MTISRAIRLLLALAASLAIAWAFFDVAHRGYVRWAGQHERPVRLVMMHWGEQAEDAVVDELVTRYTAEHPDVQIDRINAGVDFRSKLKTMMAAGTPPDLFYLPPDALPEFAKLKLIRPVDDLVAADIAANGAPAKAAFDDFFPIMLDAYRFDESTGKTGSGPLYGLPKDFTTVVMYINVDLFKQAGLRVPYDGWTWDEYAADCKKITALTNTPYAAGRKVFGGSFDLWGDTIRQVLWTYNADFFGPGGFNDVALGSPRAQEALENIRRWRFDDKIVYNNTGVGKEAKQEFFTGTIGVIGPYGRWMTPRYASISNFQWDVVPVPYKTKQDQASQIFYTAWAMSSKTSNPPEAFKLMQFLCGGAGAVLQSKLGLAIPPLKSVAYSDAFLNPPGLPKIHTQIFLDAINYARLQQLPPETDLWNRLVEDKTSAVLTLNQGTVKDCAVQIANEWHGDLSSPLLARQWPAMRWDFVGFGVAAISIAVIALLWWQARREKLGPLDAATERTGYAFILPWLIGFIALTLGPMVISLLLSFTRWTGMTPMGGALNVGTANYRELFFRDPLFYKSLKITFYFVVLAVPAAQISALAVALLMNVRVRGIAVYRTIFFLPSLIVASVVGAVLWRLMYNNDYGMVNAMLRPILRPFNLQPPDWFGIDARAWAIPAFVLMGVWGVGGAMILYLAGLKGIPASLYEAATIDGAGHSRRFINVTLPMLSPLIFYNVVMGIIGSFQVFVQAMVMTGGGPNNNTLFYVLNLYRQAFEFHNMGYASALAWVLFILLLGLTILVFRASRNIVYYEGLKT